MWVDLWMRKAHAYRVVVSDLADLLGVVGAREARETLGEELAGARVEARAVVLRELRAERIQRDHYRASVRLELRAQCTRVRVRLSDRSAHQ